MQSKLFKKTSMERITSPEKLNDYIQVANPASWMVLGAALAALMGLLIWGIFGQLTESVTFHGHEKNGQLYCYAPGGMAELLALGMEVTIVPRVSGQEIAAVKGTILTVDQQPLSFDEASQGITSDYMLASLGITGWNIAVTVQTDTPLYEGIVYDVSAVTHTLRPIEMVFR